MPDARAQQAREQHRRSLEASERAAVHREQRDRLIRQLREEDPAQWTYPALAAAVGCSPELVAAIVRGRIGKSWPTSAMNSSKSFDPNASTAHEAHGDRSCCEHQPRDQGAQSEAVIHAES